MDDESERGVDLSGDAAVAWLSSHSALARPNSLHPPRLVADALRGPTLRLTRIWHTPMDISHRFDESAGQDFCVIVMLEGRARLETEHASAELEKYGLIVLPRSGTMRMTTDEPSARAELVFGPELSQHPFFRARSNLASALPRSPMTNILVGLVTLVFSSGTTPKDRGWAHVSRSLLEACAAALSHSLTRPVSTSASSANAELFHLAMDLIEQYSHGVDFTVEALARRTNASATRLREAFAAHGTTARDAIRESRTVRALRLMEQRNHTSRAEVEAVAATAGFSSARAMTLALKRR